MKTTDVEVQCTIYREDGISWDLSVPCGVGPAERATRHCPGHGPEVEIWWDSIIVDEGWQDTSDDGDDPQPLTTPDGIQLTAEERAEIEKRCFTAAPLVALAWTEDAREDARHDAAEARMDRDCDRAIERDQR